MFPLRPSHDTKRHTQGLVLVRSLAICRRGRISTSKKAMRSEIRLISRRTKICSTPSISQIRENPKLTEVQIAVLLQERGHSGNRFYQNMLAGVSQSLICQTRNHAKSATNFDDGQIGRQQRFKNSRSSSSCRPNHSVDLCDVARSGQLARNLNPLNAVTSGFDQSTACVVIDHYPGAIPLVTPGRMCGDTITM